MCDCIFNQTNGLRWRMSDNPLFFAPTLEQAWMCPACGKIVWKEVPMVMVKQQEAAK